MTNLLKHFVRIFLLFQALTIVELLPTKVLTGNYYSEIFSQVAFSLSKVNQLYNFFTSPNNNKQYSYTTNEIFMIKKVSGKLIKLHVSKQGSIKHLTSFVNYPRINQIQALAAIDTTFYNAIVRSEALYFFKKHSTYPLIYFEVNNHECSTKVINRKFIKNERVSRIYSNYFTLY